LSSIYPNTPSPYPHHPLPTPREFNENGYKRETAKSTQNEWQKIERRKADTNTHQKGVANFLSVEKAKSKKFTRFNLFLFCCQAGV